jgi:predicted outer membrane repeat protein
MSFNSPQGMIFMLTVDSVSFSNCSFYNISNSALGIFVISGSQSLIIDNCTFSELESTSLLLSSSKGYHLVNRCSFWKINSRIQGIFLLFGVKNATIRDSSLLEIVGSIVLTEKSSLRLTNCSFSNFGSGSILSLQSGSRLVGTSLTFENSSSRCILSSEDVSITLTNSSFNNCSTSGNGGGIFLGNSSSLQCEDCCFLGNQAAISGGAIFTSTSSHTSLTKSQFMRNVAVNGDGGAVYIEGNGSCDSTMFLSNSAIKGKGGGLFGLVLGSFSGNSFQSNIAQLGGGTYFGQLAQSFMNNTFNENHAVQTKAKSCFDTSGSGGGIFVDNFTSFASFQSWYFENNTAEFFGGAIGVDFVSNSATPPSLSFPNIMNNNALYGPNFGSMWIDILFQNPFESDQIFLGEELYFEFEFKDRFNQTAFGVSCDGLFSNLSSNPFLGVTFDKTFIQLKQSERNKGLILEFSFIADQITFGNPLPNETTVLEFQVCVENWSLWTTRYFLTMCPSGYQLIGQSCVPCQAGSFLQFTSQGTAYCQECDPGKHSDGKSSSCSLCSPGSASSIFGVQYCPLCSPGSFSSKLGQSMCEICAQGTYSGLVGSSFCEKCPSGAVTINNGSSSPFFCSCPSGMFGKPWKGEACQSCTESKGSLCPFNSSIPYINSGFWRSSGSESEVFECVPGSACFSTGEDLETNCSAGYAGKRCGECIDTYFHFDTYCKRCGDKTLSSGALVTFICTIILFALHSLSSRAVRSGRFDFISFVSMLQFLALYPRISNSWPERTSALYNALSITVSDDSILQIYY